MPWLRIVAVWLVMMGTDVVHGVLRTLFLAPIVGDIRARRVCVFTGSVLVLAIACVFINWIRAGTPVKLLTIGALWVALTLFFEVGFGRFVAGYSWERIASDYNMWRGGLLPLGLAIMLLSPLLASKLRRSRLSR
jgi:hypothetical protein